MMIESPVFQVFQVWSLSRQCFPEGNLPGWGAQPRLYQVDN
jgi:hypothetical protein